MAVRRLERTDESSKLLTIEAPIILRLGLVIQARCLLVHVEFHKVKKMIKRIKYMKYMQENLKRVCMSWPVFRYISENIIFTYLK